MSVTEAKKYEDYILESAETKRDIEVVYNPIFKALKTAFTMMFQTEGFTGSDFKRLSDMRYYQGGYPSPDTPPKEHVLAIAVANLIRLEDSIEKDTFVKFLKELGVEARTTNCVPIYYTLSKEDEKKLVESWESAGIDEKLPTDKTKALALLLDRAQNLQREICEHSDMIRVDAAAEVEDKFKIKKSNFMKAVGLATLRIKRGDGVMGEKLDDVVDDMDNLQMAIEPLLKK